LIPGDLLEASIDSEKRGFEPLRRVDKVPAETAPDTEVPIVGTHIGIGEDPFDLSLFGAYDQQASAATVVAGGRGFFQLPCFGFVVKTFTGDGAHLAGIEALAAEFAMDRPVKIGIDESLNASLGKREFPHPLDFVTDSHAAATENTLVPITLKEWRCIIHGEGNLFPRETSVLDSIFIDKILQNAFSFFLTPRTDHRMIEENELQLEPPCFNDLRRLSDDLHSIFCRSEAGW
jgi:hypothetical protein